MKKEELLARIEKKEQAIVKIEKRIAKWSTGLPQEAIDVAKTYGMDGHDWKTQTRQELYANYKAYKEAHMDDCFNKDDWNKGPNIDETMRAYQDLRDAQITLDKYKNALQVEISKENELTNNKVDVIWDFLLGYQENVKKYIRDNLRWVYAYAELSRRSCDLYNNTPYTERKNPEFVEKYKSLCASEKEAKGNIHPLTEICLKRDYSHYDKDGEVEYSIDEAKLEEETLKDITARYFQLINQITKYVGTIQDASYLRINKGDLNGVIFGDKGKARVETIGAGGYNIQCYHYRCLVHPIK